MKRFWKAVSAAPADGGWAIRLDDRFVRTPARAPLILPAEDLGLAIAAEWEAVGETIEPGAMPLTGLANAAIDHVAPDPAAFAASLARYAEADLACYRAEGPATLVERQCEHWDALLAWARRRFDVDFRTTCGIIHVDQPAATIERLSHAVGVLDPFHLAGLSPLATIGGSLIAALAVLEDELSAEKAWAAVSIDDGWQLEQWGSDAEAEAALETRRGDFMAAARFLELLDRA